MRPRNREARRVLHVESTDADLESNQEGCHSNFQKVNGYKNPGAALCGLSNLLERSQIFIGLMKLSGTLQASCSDEQFNHTGPELRALLLSAGVSVFSTNKPTELEMFVQIGSYFIPTVLYLTFGQCVASVFLNVFFFYYFNNLLCRKSAKSFACNRQKYPTHTSGSVPEML